MTDQERELEGGNASGAVVQVGDTVRKPWSRSTPSVISFMRALKASGVHTPAHLGQDEQGRQILEFIPGDLAIDGPPLSRLDLTRVGSIVRAIHDASANYTPEPGAHWETAIPAPGADLICHNDLAPWNLVVGSRWIFIDWDAAAPSTRLWDLAYSAQAFTLNDVDRPPAEAALDLSAFVTGYRADVVMRSSLPSAMAHRAGAMHSMLATAHSSGTEPWSSMYVNGHGDHWRAVTRYVGTHQGHWGQALAASLAG